MGENSALSHPRGAIFASALIYVAVTGWMGRHVLGSLGTAIASDAGDPILNAAILAWTSVQVPWTDAWFQFPIFHPTPDALTLSEHLLGISMIATPIYWMTGNPLIAYNLTLLLSFPLCGLAMFLLVRRLTGSPSAAFLSGLAFAFAPYRASQLPHVQMLASFWAPLALLGLHRFVEAGPPSPLDSTRGALSEVEGRRDPPYTTRALCGPGFAGWHCSRSAGCCRARRTATFWCTSPCSSASGFCGSWRHGAAGATWCSWRLPGRSRWCRWRRFCTDISPRSARWDCRGTSARSPRSAQTSPLHFALRRH